MQGPEVAVRHTHNSYIPKRCCGLTIPSSARPYTARIYHESNNLDLEICHKSNDWDSLGDKTDETTWMTTAFDHGCKVAGAYRVLC